jgi:hypothetical protein
MRTTLLEVNFSTIEDCGGSGICMHYGCMVIAMGLVYPLSELVDIFPVRLVSTFHRVFSVYLTLAIYPI